MAAEPPKITTDEKKLPELDLNSPPTEENSLPPKMEFSMNSRPTHPGRIIDTRD
jgi:hypothetical protein